jgi:hypothetical protein
LICSLGHVWCSPKSFQDTYGFYICWLPFVLICPQRYFSYSCRSE